MTTTLLLMVFALMILCISLMRRIIKLEYSNFDLNERLNLSDEEYIDLFNENLKLSEKISDAKLIKQLQK